jgi:hypothetical protein
MKRTTTKDTSNISSRHKRDRSITDISQEKTNKKPKNNESDEDFGSLIELDNKTEDINWNEWVAATSTRNFLLDDCLLDVLQNKGSTLTKVNSSYQDMFIETLSPNNPKSFVSSIMQQGTKFEMEVYNLIVDKIGSKNIINIGGDCNPRSEQKYLDTIKSMNDGIPVIYQGILRNYNNNTYGIPDLLIRSDHLHLLIRKVHISKKEKHVAAPELHIKRGSKGYHYVVVDIKFKTLHFKSDGLHLRNDGIMKAHKGQLCVYNQALGVMQGYEPPAAFILGWKWKYVSKTKEYRGNNCFDRLGRIDYRRSDKVYVELTEKAISWVLKVRQEADSWDLSSTPLPCEELYPNMCNRYDFPHHGLKRKFAKNIDELSIIWKCGPKQRRIAHENGIYSWKDPRCTPETLGIKGEYTSNIVARILEANRSENQTIFPEYISNNFADWKNPRHLEFFVDFEMTCSVFTEFEDMPWADGDSVIFMIGVGYICPESGEWIYRDFTLDKLDTDGEFTICSEFSKYVNETIRNYDCYDTPSFYHWSHAEPSAWTRAVKRHSPTSLKWYDFEWVDMLKIFHEEPIGVKGCFAYGLKEVARTFHKLGYIETIWDKNSSCADGADAAVSAYRVDKETRRKGVSFKTDPLTREIIKYNEVDCKVLQEIIDYLRNNHIDEEDEDLDNSDNTVDKKESISVDKTHFKKRKISVTRSDDEDDMDHCESISESDEDYE